MPSAFVAELTFMMKEYKRLLLLLLVMLCLAGSSLASVTTYYYQTSGNRINPVNDAAGPTTLPSVIRFSYSTPVVITKISILDASTQYNRIYIENDAENIVYQSSAATSGTATFNVSLNASVVYKLFADRGGSSYVYNSYYGFAEQNPTRNYLSLLSWKSPIDSSYSTTNTIGLGAMTIYYNASEYLYLSVNDSRTNTSLQNFCTNITTVNQGSSNVCNAVAYNVTSILSNATIGVNSQTYENNFQTIVADTHRSGFNTSFVVSNGTDNLLWVPHFNSATSCGVSNLATYGSYTSVNMTHNVMVSDEFTEYCMVEAMSNETDRIDYCYNTIVNTASAYGTIPVWVMGADYTTSGTLPITLLSSDTASDATVRDIKLLYIASNNTAVTPSNRTKYKNLANQMSLDHVQYESKHTSSTSSVTGQQISYWLADGRNAAASFTSDPFINGGYFYDAITAMLAACSQTGNTSFCGIAANYTDQMLSADWNGTGGGSNDFRTSPFGWQYNTTPNPYKIKASSSTAYYFIGSNPQWDDSDRPRGLMDLDILRAANITLNGTLTGVWANLSDYGLAWNKNPTVQATTTCLQYYFNGSCISGGQQNGYYSNGMGAGLFTFYNTSSFSAKINEALGHYNFGTHTFDSTACGDGGTYRGVRTTKSLGIGIGKEQAIYGNNPITSCAGPSPTTYTIAGTSVLLNSPGNSTLQNTSTVTLNITVYNNNVTTGGGSQGTLPQVLYNSTFAASPAGDGWSLGSWGWTSNAGGVINNTADSGSSAWTQNLSLTQMTNGYNITLNMSMTNFTNAKIYFGTNSGTQDGDRVLLERNGAGGSLVNVKHDGGAFSSFTVNANTYVTVSIVVNLTAGNVTVRSGASSWTDALANSHLSTNGSYIAFVPGVNMTGNSALDQFGWNISNINVTNTGNAYTTGGSPQNSSINVTIFDTIGNALLNISNVLPNATNIVYSWGTLTDGVHNWVTQVSTVNENTNYSFTFNTSSGVNGTTATFCTTNSLINYSVAGNYTITVFNISNNTYFNVTPFNYNYNGSNIVYPSLPAYQSYVNMSLYNGVNGSFLGFCGTASNGSTTLTDCITGPGNLILYNIIGNLSILWYNVSGGVYFNQSVTVNNWNYTSAFQNNTVQGYLRINTTQIYTNNSILSFNATNNKLTNTTTNNYLQLGCNNGANNVIVRVNGNYTQNYTGNCGILTTTSMNATNIYDNLFTITANSGGIAINNFSINITDGIFSAGQVINDTTTNGTLVFRLLQGYSYTFTINPDMYSILHYSLPASSSTSFYNFSLFTANSIEMHFFNESTNRQLNNVNVTIQVISDQYANNYSTFNGTIIVPFLVPSNYTIIYGYDPAIPRNYYLQLTPQSYNNITMYVVDGGISTIYLPIVVDQNNLALPGAQIQLLRGYIVNNQYVYLPVEMTLTDTNGQGVLRVVPNVINYKLLISKNGQVLTTAPTKFTTSTNTYVLSSTVSSLTSIATIPGISKSLTFNNDTGTYVFTWTDTSNLITNACMMVTQSKGITSSTVYNQCLASNIGSLTYTVNDTNETRYSATAQLQTSTTFSDYSYGPLTADYTSSANVFGRIGMLLLLMTLITVGLVANESGSDGMIIMSLVMMVLFGVIGIIAYSWEAYIGVIIFGIILIYKTRR
jgi:hypothetical protein